MKKLLSLLLTLAVVTNLFACAAVSREGNGTDDSSSVKPDEEDMQMLQAYYDIVAGLTDYTENGELTYRLRDEDGNLIKKLSGQEALAYAWETLQGMKEVDRWIGTKWHRPDAYGKTIEWDRQKVFADFVVAEDVLLSVTEYRMDLLGNQTEAIPQYAWKYNADGTVSEGDREQNIGWLTPIRNTSGGFYTYDDQGKLEKIRYYGEDGSICQLREFTYDDTGKLMQQTQRDASGETVYSYAYDTDGRLTLIAWTALQLEYTLAYTYNEQGALLREIGTTYQPTSGGHRYITDTYSVDYTYCDGILTSGVYTYQLWQGWWQVATGEITENRPVVQRQESVLFETDAKGRVTKRTVQCEDAIYLATGKVWEKTQDAWQTTEYTYGTYYDYIPAQQEN